MRRRLQPGTREHAIAIASKFIDELRQKQHAAMLLGASGNWPKPVWAVFTTCSLLDGGDRMIGYRADNSIVWGKQIGCFRYDGQSLEGDTQAVRRLLAVAGLMEVKEMPKEID